MFAARVARAGGVDGRDRMTSALSTMPPRLGLRPVSEPRVFARADGTVGGVIILAESHLALHAVPERSIVRGDLFSCKEGDLSADLRCLDQHYDVTALWHEMIPREVSSARQPMSEIAAHVARSLGALRGDRASWGHLALEVDASGDATLADLDAVDRLAARLLDHLGLRLPERLCHRFTPIGVTLVRFGGQGCLVIHTWPEHQLATVDLSCQLACLESAVPRLFDGHLVDWVGGRVVSVAEPDTGSRRATCCDAPTGRRAR